MVMTYFPKSEEIVNKGEQYSDSGTPAAVFKEIENYEATFISEMHSLPKRLGKKEKDTITNEIDGLSRRINDVWEKAIKDLFDNAKRVIGGIDGEE